VAQGGATSALQGQLSDLLKAIVECPTKVGLSIFGTAADIVGNLIQDDPSRVPQMIESGVLPSIMSALTKDTLRSYESLSCIPALLGAVSLHTKGEELILQGPVQPLRLVLDAFSDPSFAPLLHGQPQLAQVISTHVDKVLKNRPGGSTKLVEHVVDCVLDSLKSCLEQGKSYPRWTPAMVEDKTDYLADRLAEFGSFCWSVLGNNEQGCCWSETSTSWSVCPTTCARSTGVNSIRSEGSSYSRAAAKAATQPW
jgi:hypothetical protein